MPDAPRTFKMSPPADAPPGPEGGASQLPADAGPVLPEGEELPAEAQQTVTADGKVRVKGFPMPEGMEAPPGSVRFKHDCCQAVRPNPEDPDGGVVPVQKEPYLVARGPLKPTPLFGMWLLGVGTLGVAAFGFAVAQVPVATAVLVGIAALVALYLVVSLLMADAATKKVRVEGVRHVIEPQLERGKVFHMTLDTAGTFVPSSLRATITDLRSPGLRPVEKPEVDAAGRTHYKVRPQGRGLLTFKGLNVRLETRNGLWIQDQEYRLRTTVEVLPSLPAASMRSILTGYVPFGLNAPQSLVKLYRSIEYEETKEYGPGDRLKDLDWKRIAINGQLIVRKRWSDVEGTILLVIDLGPSMLQDQAGFRNLDLAVELAHEFADAGLRRNHEVGLVAFNQERIVDHVKPTRKKTQMGRLAQHLAFIADHHLPEEGEKPVEVVITGDPENLRLGMQQVIKQRATAMATLIFLTDLQTTPEEIVQSIGKSVQSGLRACVMLLPGPKLKPVPLSQQKKGRKLEAQEEEVRGVAHTNKMREILLARGVDFMEVHPLPEEFEVNTPVPEEIRAEVEALRAQRMQQDGDVQLPPGAVAVGFGPPPAPPAPALRSEYAPGGAYSSPAADSAGAGGAPGAAAGGAAKNGAAAKPKPVEAMPKQQRSGRSL
ncbi:MAG TPA: DUF58 domain-containing protein [Candidatus Thermoplasmatota archaeon]|nr:DUF58 domain-containing protein [Candidatus Thermoplasmatota archaeon]